MKIDAASCAAQVLRGDPRSLPSFASPLTVAGIHDAGGTFVEDDMHRSRKNSGTLAFVALAAVAVVLGGCLAGQPRFTDDTPAGFWLGIWHGMVAPVSLVVGLFKDEVRVYERHNTGRWYDFGFLLGVTSLWGANHARTRRRPCARCRGVVVVSP